MTSALQSMLLEGPSIRSWCRLRDKHVGRKKKVTLSTEPETAVPVVLIAIEKQIVTSLKLRNRNTTGIGNPEGCSSGEAARFLRGDESMLRRTFRRYAAGDRV